MACSRILTRNNKVLTQLAKLGRGCSPATQGDQSIGTGKELGFRVAKWGRGKVSASLCLLDSTSRSLIMS
jgi:hypothetical protein